jgi:hypothetical protein
MATCSCAGPIINSSLVRHIDYCLYALGLYWILLGMGCAVMIIGDVIGCDAMRRTVENVRSPGAGGGQSCMTNGFLHMYDAAYTLALTCASLLRSPHCALYVYFTIRTGIPLTDYKHDDRSAGYVEPVKTALVVMWR